MSILVTRGRKRKMEASHIGGDNIAVNIPSPKRAQSSSSLPGSASGDSLVEYHQVCGFVTEENARNNSGEFIKQPCLLGDLWLEKYPLPLSSITPRKIRTGNKRFDSLLPHIEGFGYRPLQKIAQGKFGSVILAQHVGAANKEDRECRAVAIKFIKHKRDSSSLSVLSREGESASIDMPDEMSIHRQQDHEHIVSFLDSVRFDGLIGMVLEYCAHGNLEQLLTMKAAKLLTEPVARNYFIQLHSSLQYLHTQGVAHLDVCLQNILVSQGNRIKLTDFGDARRCSAGAIEAAVWAGTPGYQAPEIIRKVPYNPRQADIWSLGVVLYTITTGKLPYGIELSGMLSKMEKEVPFPDERTVPLSRAIKEVLRGLLAYAPECRYTLNRTRNAEFYQEPTSTVHIGNFYIVQKPRKVRESVQGAELKQKYEV